MCRRSRKLRRRPRASARTPTCRRHQAQAPPRSWHGFWGCRWCWRSLDRPSHGAEGWGRARVGVRRRLLCLPLSLSIHRQTLSPHRMDRPAVWEGLRGGSATKFASEVQRVAAHDAHAAKRFLTTHTAPVQQRAASMLHTATDTARVRCPSCLPARCDLHPLLIPSPSTPPLNPCHRALQRTPRTAQRTQSPPRGHTSRPQHPQRARASPRRSALPRRLLQSPPRRPRRPPRPRCAHSHLAWTARAAVL